MILQTYVKNQRTKRKEEECHERLRRAARFYGKERKKKKKKVIETDHSAPDTSWHDLLNAIFLRHDIYNRREEK